jgi:hypothetical protein
MKHRPIVLVLILAAAAGLVLFLRRPDAAPPVRPPAPAVEKRPEGTPPTSSEAPPPRPGTSKRPLTGPPEEQEFKFDDRKPLIEQVRPLLEAVHFDAEVIKACRGRAEEVATAIVALLKEVATTSNMREMGLALLKDLKTASAVPAILELARRDPDASVRADAIRTLEAFPSVVSAADGRGLFDGAKTVEERTAAVELLGNLGDAASLPFLEDVAKSYPDADVLREAGRAAQKVRIESSAKREVELVQVLHQEGHALRGWALSRIVAGRKPEMAHHLREVLEAERKLPKARADVSFQYHLLRGLGELGQELSPEEKSFVENYGR